MNTVILLLSIAGGAFFVKESDGPWGIMAWLRNTLMNNKYVGVFFFKLFSCWMCSGTWSGVVIYLLTSQSITLPDLVVWGFGGGALCLMFGTILERLQRI